MDTLDGLIAQIQATPGDDGPRLAWAQAVGGERGELVVVQCRLASGVVSNRDEWRELRARERDLLFVYGVAWSGLAGEFPSSCMFRRGFVESAEIACSHDSRLDQIAARLPIARSLSNVVVDQDDYDLARLTANPRSRSIAALRVDNDRAVDRVIDQHVALRALSLSNCSLARTKRLAASGLLANVERLEIEFVEGGAEMVAAASRLRALTVSDDLDPYAHTIPISVVELSVRIPGGIEDVAKLAIASKLQRLSVDTLEFEWDLDSMKSLEALRSLDLSRAKPRLAYRPLSVHGKEVLPALRELSLGMRFDEQDVEAAAVALGPQLDTLHWGASLPRDPLDTAFQNLKWRGRIPPYAMGKAPKPLESGNAKIAAHVAGEFIVGMTVPWANRPLEYGDDPRALWFEGGGVAIRS